MKAFLLGLSNGGICLSYCLPVLLPVILGEAKGAKSNFGLLGQFLAGRLGGYLAFGGVSWWLGALLRHSQRPGAIPAWITGLIYAVLAGSLLLYALSEHPVGARACGKFRFHRFKDSVWFPGWLGFTTGINLCPPFLGAVTESLLMDQLVGSLLFFVFFFVGTSIWLIPVPVIGVFRKNENARIIGKMMAGLFFIYYLYQAIYYFSGKISL